MIAQINPDVQTTENGTITTAGVPSMVRPHVVGATEAILALSQLDRAQRTDLLLHHLLECTMRGDADACREALQEWWSDLEIRANGVTRDVLREAFLLAGWVADDASQRPNSAIIVYRGTTPRRRRGLSWTASAEKARWFAERCLLFGAASAAVYRAEVQPAQMLGYFSDRNEAEYVVDARDITIDRLALINNVGVR